VSTFANMALPEVQEMQAGQLLIRYLDQGLGRVEQATGEVGTVDTPLAQLSKEERNALIAAGRAELERISRAGKRHHTRLRSVASC
jgi:hypothetical protein